MSAVADVARVGDEIVVTPTLGLLPELKEIGARWDPRGRTWRMAACRMNAVALAEVIGEHGLDVPPPVPAEISDGRLFSWQRPLAGRLVSAPRGQIVVATPGLGKTAISIVAADQAVPDDQVVVVAPAPLLRNWRREIKYWAKDPTAYVFQGTKIDWDAVRAARWLIVSWQVLALHQDWFVTDRGDPWKLWIMDESVMGKSRRSTFSMAVRGGTRRGKVDPLTGKKKTADKRWENLRAGIDRVWLLSGSPTTRYADDLYSQLAMVWPAAFRSYWRFAERYCVIEENRWSPGPGTVVATRRDRDAKADNSDLVIVLNQEAVLDLPEFLPEAVDVELGGRQLQAYRDMERGFVAQLGSGRELVADTKMSQLVYLQQIVSYWDGESAKHDAVRDLIVGGAYDRPILVWTHWREAADALTGMLSDAGVRTIHVRGGESQTRQDAGIEAYKAGDYDVMVLSLGVGKFGHTLTNTRTVIYVDKTWNADDYYQSLRRVRRIGLTERPVLVSVRAPGTVDELVEMNLEGKVEGISRMTNADLKELLLGLGR